MYYVALLYIYTYKEFIKLIFLIEWIKPDLSPETRRSLRSEMEKPIADKDEPGFIYAYRLLEGNV